MRRDAACCVSATRSSAARADYLGALLPLFPLHPSHYLRSNEPTNPNNHIFTKRLCLRLLKPSDAADIVRLLGNDSEAVQMLASISDPVTEAAALDWIDRRTGPDQHVFAILLKSSGEFIGAIGFGGAKELPYVGYWIGRLHWNEGYATEAVAGLIDYARWLGIQALQADTFPDNPASARVLAKAGFANKGRIQLNLPMRGGVRELDHHEKDLSVDISELHHGQSGN